MITEYDSYHCVDKPEPGMLYTQALINHRFDIKPKIETVKVVFDYPDGTSETVIDMANGSDPNNRLGESGFVIAWSGAPIRGHGDGTAQITATYEPDESPFVKVDAYVGFADDYPPTIPSVVIGLDGSMTYYGASGKRELDSPRTWGLLKRFKTWRDFI